MSDVMMISKEIPSEKDTPTAPNFHFASLLHVAGKALLDSRDLASSELVRLFQGAGIPAEVK